MAGSILATPAGQLQLNIEPTELCQLIANVLAGARAQRLAMQRAKEPPAEIQFVGIPGDDPEQPLQVSIEALRCCMVIPIPRVGAGILVPAGHVGGGGPRPA